VFYSLVLFFMHHPVFPSRTVILSVVSSSSYKTRYLWYLSMLIEYPPQIASFLGENGHCWRVCWW